MGQETTGAGGLAKALRTVPVVLDLAERARRRASPSAFIIDFTNPVGIVTRALLSAGHRAVGLCNVAIGFQREFAALLGVAPSRVSLGHVGLNHLTWERSVWLDGADVLPELLGKHADEIASHTGLPAGPISNPGDSAIQAVLHPAKGTWLYFVTVNLATGRTVYSNTLAEHEKATQEFAAWLRAHPSYKK